MMSGLLDEPEMLSWGKLSQWVLDRRLDGPDTRSGCCGKIKRRFPGRPACNVAAMSLYVITVAQSGGG